MQCLFILVSDNSIVKRGIREEDLPNVFTTDPAHMGMVHLKRTPAFALQRFHLVAVLSEYTVNNPIRVVNPYHGWIGQPCLWSRLCREVSRRVKDTAPSPKAEAVVVTRALLFHERHVTYDIAAMYAQ